MFDMFSLLYIIIFGSVAYLLMCVDPDDQGVLPWLHRSIERMI